MDLSYPNSRLGVVKECMKLLKHLPLSPVKQLRLEVLLLNTAIALLSDALLDANPKSCSETSCEEILLMMKSPNASCSFYQDLLQALTALGK